MSKEEIKGIMGELKTQVTIIGTFVAIFWILEFVNQLFFGDRLDNFGIIPRHIIGLRGILFAPFLHANFAHLITNTIPFIVLAWFVMLQETADFFFVTIITMLVGGWGVWLFGPRNSVTIGASILIFGYLGFLLLRGYFQRNFPSILLSLMVFLLYGGIIWGVLPSAPRVSWQGHLFGFIGGVLAAKLMTKQRSI
jgi:membrane associated rhomboid family serine protease